jgi:hypothetical protein
MRFIAFATIALLAACTQQGPRPRAVPQSANPSAVIAADIAFNRLAQEKGQWTAFRETAARQATMFMPDAVDAQTWLKGRADPAKSIKWQAHKSFMSCDGKTGVTTGAWQQAGGPYGYFTTVWFWIAKAKPDPNMPQGAFGDGEWKWVLDHREALAAPRKAPEFIEAKVASCKGRATAPIIAPAEGVQMKVMFSRDQSLSWEWQVRPDKSRTIKVRLWNGAGFDDVLTDDVLANDVAGPASGR